MIQNDILNHRIMKAHGEKVREIRDSVLDYFGNMEWFFIKHPNLNYASPFMWILNGRDIGKVKEILDREIR